MTPTEYEYDRQADLIDEHIDRINLESFFNLMDDFNINLDNRVKILLDFSGDENNKALIATTLIGILSKTIFNIERTMEKQLSGKGED